MATSKNYLVSETPKYFLPATAAITEQAAFEVHNLSASTGRQSAQLDLGASPRPRRYTWRAFVQLQATPAVGAQIKIYLKTSDGSHPDNDDGTGEMALSSVNKLKNLIYLGSIIVDEAAANVEMVKSGSIEIDARYVNVVYYNATTVATTNDVDENGFILTAVPDELQ